jgi:hypothetical protein
MRPFRLSFERVGQTGKASHLEVFLGLERLTIRQRRRQTKSFDLSAMPIKAVAEPLEEHIQGNLHATPRSDRGRGDAVHPVQPNLDLVPIVRRAIVDGEEIAVQLQWLRGRLRASGDDRACNDGKNEHSQHHGLS